MSAILPDLDASSLIGKIRAGEVPREFVLFAARGLLPIPQEELVAVLGFLASHEDTEIREQSRASLADLPARVVLSFAQNQRANPEHLDSLASASSDASTLEAILRNRSTSDETVAKLAARVSQNLQEVIVINQERILRAPGILDSLLTNPDLSADVRRRALETREEFFDKKTRLADAAAAAEEVRLSEADERLMYELMDLASKYEESSPSPPMEIPEGESEEKKSVWQQILLMPVSEKVQRAFKGGMTERSILIRDRNKLVSSAVIRSPRITESEVEGYAGMRNIEEEILRVIGSGRQWTSKYNILLALVRNPKAPIGVVLPLINRLTLRDLKSLGSDRNVTEVIRTASKKLYGNRHKQ